MITDADFDRVLGEYREAIERYEESVNDAVAYAERVAEHLWVMGAPHERLDAEIPDV